MMPSIPASDKSSDDPDPISVVLYHRVEEAEGWQDILSLYHDPIQELVTTTLAQIHPQHPPLEVSFLWTSDEVIHLYNKGFRGEDAPTNVLSFPSYTREELQKQLGSVPSNRPLPLGDVVLALETIEREALREGKLFYHHLAHLIVHGVLHLWGYDHQEEEEAAVMEALETAVLGGWGFPNPYGDREREENKGRKGS